MQAASAPLQAKVRSLQGGRAADKPVERACDRMLLRGGIMMLRTLVAGLLAAGVLVSVTIGVVSQVPAAPSGRLMVYTSQPSDQMAKVVEAFRKAHPDIRIELFRSGTTEVMNKLQAELAAGRPQADVVLIADALAITQPNNH